MGNASDEGAVHLPTVFDSRWRKAWPNGEKVGKGRIEVTQCCAFCEFAFTYRDRYNGGPYERYGPK